MTLIDFSQIEDFDAALRENGQLPVDFELEEIVIGWWAGVAIVTSNQTGIKRSYPAGNGSIFPADFADELEQRIFE